MLVISSTADAADRRWNNGTGSFVFNTGGNWVGGVAPGLLDVAQFGLSGGFFQSTYTVSFNNNATNQALHIEDDLVTFNLISRMYTVTTAAGIVIGNQAGGFPGRLTVMNGTVSSSTNIDVGAAANTSGTMVVGANGLISGSPGLNIGKLGAGTLTVDSGGDISSTGATTIGVGTGITGAATIIGEGSTLFTGTLNVGSTGNGTVNVQLGGLLQNSGDAVLGTGSLFTGVGTGIVNVMNTGSVWNSLGLLEIGDGGTGKVNITLGGKATGADNVIGANISNSGEVNVDGLSSLWDNSGTLTVGGLGAGTLNITNQGVVENTFGIIGDVSLPTSIGTVDVNGAGSQWTNTGILTVGNAGTGTLNITDGGTVQNSSGRVGFASSGIGNVIVAGTGSVWDNSGSLAVGNSGEGMLSITSGGKVQNTSAIVGNDVDSKGMVTVDGSDSLWDNSSDVLIGNVGEGTLSITGGGKVESVEGTVGIRPEGIGLVTVDGDGSLWENSGPLVIGNFAQGTPNVTAGGTLEITGGGHVTSAPGGDFDVIGSQADSTGLVTVDGEGSLWDISGRIFVGEEGDGILNITGGGIVRAIGGAVGVGPSGSGRVTVDGEGSLWDNSGGLQLGANGHATLEITAGGVVQNISGAISGLADSPSAAIVSGLGSQWLNSGSLSVGTLGTVTLDVTDGGKVTADGNVINGDSSIGRVAGSTGTVTVASTVAGVDSTLEIGARLGIGFDFFTQNNGGVGTLRIQPGGAVNVTHDTVVSLGDLLSLEGGTLSASNILFQDGGSADTNFEWTSGTLHVEAFAGDLVNQAGVLAPGNSAGSTSIQGNYNQLADATLQIEIGGTSQTFQYDVVRTTGNAFLGGDLELALVNGFVPSTADTFSILQASLNLFNAFANVANGQRLTTTDGLGSFLVNYGAGSPFNQNQIILSAFQPANAFTADFDDDGDVDRDDLIQWQGDFGLNALSDADNDGDSDGADFLAWQRQLGSAEVVAAAESVPEPATLLLLVSGVLANVLGRRAVS